MARRGGLSRDKVVEAGLARIDEHGIDALSMRDLAADLDVSPMALYRHVRNKDELLDLVADRVIERFVPEPADGPWPEQAARICRRMRAELLAHPGVASRVWQRPITSSATSLEVNVAMVSLLVEAGLPRDAVPGVYWMLATYTHGSVLLEIERRRARGERPRHDDATRRTNLTALVVALGAEIADTDVLASVLSTDFSDDQFEDGLQTVLRGLGATVDTR